MVFDTLANMATYLTSPRRYAGQVVSCNEDDGLYVLNAATDTWVSKGSTGGGDFSGPASSTDSAIVLFDGVGGKTGKDSAKTIVTTLGADDTTVPTSKAVADSISGFGAGDVVGPASATDGTLVQYDGVTGKLLKDGLTVGTGASNIVQLDGTSKLPAVDGSQLTNLPGGGDVTGPASAIADSVPIFSGTGGKTLKQGPVIGTAVNNIPKITDASVADTNFAVFSATGIDGKTPTEVRSALNVADGATANTGDVVGPASATADSLPVFNSTTGKIIKQGPAIGIGSGNISSFDGAGAADNDYVKLTATGLEGRSYSEVRTDLNVADGATANTASSTTPASLGTAAVGTGTTYARADHVHSDTGITKTTATADQNMDNHDVQDIKVATFDIEYDNGNSSTSITIDWNNGNHQKVTMTGDCTFTFTAPTPGIGTLWLKVIQDGTGTRLVTLPAYKTAGGDAFVATTTAAAIDFLVFYYDGSVYYLMPAQAFATPA